MSDIEKDFLAFESSVDYDVVMSDPIITQEDIEGSIVNNSSLSNIEYVICFELFSSYPSIIKIEKMIVEEVFNHSLSNLEKKNYDRLLEILNKDEIQTGDERDEVYGILFDSLSEIDKLKIEPKYKEYENIIVP